MEEKRSLWQRFNDPKAELTRKEFIVAYFGWWVACFIIVFIVDIIFSPKSMRGMAIGLSFGFFQIFAMRLRYLGLNKWIALLAFPLITNPMLFIYLVIRGDEKAPE